MKTLSSIICILALLVIGLGAYVRLSDAGLGCPDWPGCYGHVTVPEEHQIGSGKLPYTPSDSDRPLESHKAWKEMSHRYLAGSLGLLILIQFFLSLYCKKNRLLSFILLTLVFFQAALGMWTVTLKLHPGIVMLHLLGGFATFALAWTIRYKVFLAASIKKLDAPDSPALPWLKPMVTFGIGLLVIQIILGGWVSANYASLACPDFPTCQGKWLPETDFVSGFQIFTELGHDYEGGWMTNPARVAIHLAHRVGALVNTLYIIFLGWLLLKKAPATYRTNTFVLLGLLVTQISLGLSNIFFRLPLHVAVSHNVVAVLLLVTYITLVLRKQA